MVTIKTLPDNKWLIILTNAVITIITTIIIVWSFPNESGPNFPYYEINKPWTSKTLIAEFNFYSFRSKSEIESDKQNLLREYNPLYIMDFDVEEQAVAESVTAEADIQILDSELEQASAQIAALQKEVEQLKKQQPDSL